ncbi:MAG: glutamate 5-kinase [Chthoniobacterales bacterium]
MKRVVIKFGTGVLTKKEGCALDPSRFRQFAKEVAALKKRGLECILVSSGAVAAGVDLLGFNKRPQELASKQACAAAGQPRLMRLYETCFAKHKLHVAQLLLTHGDIDSRSRRINAKNTLECLLARKNVIPIINENDSVAVEELRVGDNDRLCAELAVMAKADLLIIMTSVDGVLDGNRRIPVVQDISDVLHLVREETGRFSTGGMKTKLEAVRFALENGVESVIVNGKKNDQICDSIKGNKQTGTRFPITRKSKVKS